MMTRIFQRKKTFTGKARKSRRGQEMVRRKEEIFYGVGESSLGAVLLASSEAGVVAILFGEDEESLTADLEKDFAEARLVREDRDAGELLARVVAYIEAPVGRLNLKLDLRGTAFQKQVWQAVRKIPAGRTATYADVAQRIGSPKAMRAVGSACANNHLSIVVPCHRVLRSDGTFGPRDRRDAQRMYALLRRETGNGVPPT
jgi:AraC family transcriptional regulator, regulatory protein of adaptative response / methylated-DNA-[protein]-cysteine methyltransferase